MDKDRIEGIGKHIVGGAKEEIGKLVGDAKLQAEGAGEKAAGRVQNAVGSARDAARDAISK